MGWAVFAHADGVVGEDIKHGQFHDRRQANGWAHVIGKDEKGCPEGLQAAQYQAVADRAHDVFANAEMKITAGVIAGGKIAGSLERQQRVSRGGQIGRSAQKPRHSLGDLVEHLAR